MKRTCNWCLQELPTTHRKERKYCNKQCFDQYQRHNNSITYMCIQCNTPYIVLRSSKRKKLCSKLCERQWKKNPDVVACRLEATRITNTERYGVPYTTMSPNAIAAGKQTKLKKYGSVGYCNPIKGKQTKLKKYGTLNFSEKSKQTKLKKYGSMGYCNPVKGKQAKLKKYGTLNFSEKSKQTKLKKYGTLNFSEKSKQTINTRYGSRRAMNVQVKYKRLKKKLESLSIELNFTMNEYQFGYKYIKYPFVCRKCKATFTDYVTNGHIPICPACHPMPISSFEIEVYDFIKQYVTDAGQHDRTILRGRELDIYIPSHHLAIECDGVYWHSELNGKNKTYHLNKTELCMIAGVQLLHIFDSEWYNSPLIVKSIIRRYLNVPTTVIFARQCELRSVPAEEAHDFLCKNHLQGNDNASVRYGLYHIDKLIQIMTFKPARYDKSIEWEISRFASEIDYTITGGASKLWSHFIKIHNPQSCLSYSDRRWFTGQTYTKLGFTNIKNTSPSYHYFHSPLQLESRINYQKHKLKDKLQHYNASNTEWENMVSNGYNRIWDCGHSKYVWNK